MTRKRYFSILALLLALTTIAGCFLACADTNAGGDETEGGTRDSVTTDESRLYPDLPDVKYGGYTFTMLHWTVAGWDSRRCRDFFAETENADPINDAVYRRNTIIGEKYDVNFELVEQDRGEILNDIKASVNAGDDAYDLVVPRIAELTPLVTDGYLYDIFKLEYLDLEKPWWDQNSIESMSVCNKLYAISSDMSINDKDATAAIAFNKDLAADNQSVPDLYAMVRDKTWTMDKMVAIYSQTARDLNGDDKMDEEDQYGFIGGHDVSATFFHGGGGRYVTKDENDEPVLSFESDRNFALAELLYEIVTDTDVFYHHHKMSYTDDGDYEKFFASGHGLFFWMRLDNVTSMRGADMTFGILPIPMYDEQQGEYFSAVSQHTGGLLSVPAGGTDFDRTSVILEAMVAESKYTLLPAYYEISLKDKQTRDDESKEMLDIIISNRVYDIGELYDLTTMGSTMLYLADQNSFNISSAYSSSLSTSEKNIDKFIDFVTKLP